MTRQITLPKKLDIRKALATSPPEPDFVLPGLPTGTVGALVAPGATGKTIFLLQTCVAKAVGMAIFGGLFAKTGDALAPPAKVALVVAEESFDVMHMRLHSVVAHALREINPLLEPEAISRFHDCLCANLDLYPLAGSTKLLIGGGGDSGAGWEKLHKIAAGVRLLVIDPLRQFHTGDENDSWAMTSVLQSLQTIASGHRCAVMVAHHTNKSSTLNGQGDRAGASRGSAAFTDGVRWQLNLSALDDSLAGEYGLGRDTQSGFIRADLAKANYLAPQPPQVLRREAGGVFELVRKSGAKKRGRV